MNPVICVFFNKDLDLHSIDILIYLAIYHRSSLLFQGAICNYTNVPHGGAVAPCLATPLLPVGGSIHLTGVGHMAFVHPSIIYVWSLPGRDLSVSGEAPGFH